MNWQFLLTSIFGLSIFFVAIVTVLFYLQHRIARKHRRNESPLSHPTDGKYFRRFLPLELAARYDERIQNFIAMKRPNFTWKDYKWHIMVIVGALLIVGRFALVHRYDYIQAIDITDSEMQVFSRAHNSLQNSTTEQLPNAESIFKLLKSKTLILLQSSNSPIAQLANSQWEIWASKNGVSIRKCRLGVWKQCATPSSLFVVLPGAWETQKLDELSVSNVAVLLYGSPLETAGPSTWEWHDLKFENTKRSSRPYLILAGDSLLTLGFDAGTIIAAEPFANDYRVKSAAGDAYAINSDRSFSGTIETRLKAITIANSRFVWLDFSPNLQDQPAVIDEIKFKALWSSVFRYLMKQTYSAIASWPNGAKFGGLIAYNVDDHAERSSLVVDFLDENKIPMTWFLTSDIAQKDKVLRNLDDVGELACVSDNKTALTQDPINQQMRRLARCQKVVLQLNSYTPKGIHPPEEQFNSETLDALISIGYSYVFTRNENERLVPVIQKSEDKSKQLVFLNRSTSDDFQLMTIGGLSRTEAEHRAEEEIKWLKITGGLYSYSFSSHNLDSHHLQIVKTIAAELTKEKAYFETAKEIANWWSYRAALVLGLPTEASSLEKFKPKKLQVDERGQLTEGAL